MNRLSCYLVKPNNSRYWQLRYRRPGDKRERSKSLGVRDKLAAERKKADFIREFEREEVGILPSRPIRETAAASLAVLFDAFLLDQENQRNDAKYVENLRRYLRIPSEACGWERLADVTSAAFKGWRSGAAAKNSPTTLNHYLTSWKTFFNWLVSMERLEHNPLRSVSKLKSGERSIERRAISDDEIERFLAMAPAPRRLIYLVALHTGLRRNELKLLEWRDLHLQEEIPMLKLRATTEKNRKGSVIFLHPELVTALTEARSKSAAPDDRVLRMFKGLDPLKRDLAKAGIPFQDELGRRFDLHATRMTFNTRLANANVPIRIAMEAMRHSEERLTTAVYMDPSSLPVAAAVTSLAPLQSSKLSGGLSDQLSGDCTTSRHTTQQDATRHQAGEPTLSTHVERVSHVAPHNDTKEKASELLCSEAFIGSGGRDRTYDLKVFPS